MGGMKKHEVGGNARTIPHAGGKKFAALANPVPCGNNDPAQSKTAPMNFFREWALRRRWIM